ncbi:MAG: S-layer homology domain-containing protein [Lachnospiraceae bacterium]|nr:S-layer homology domain-containing protein [Lachnospiraceae bacterium]
MRNLKDKTKFIISVLTTLIIFLEVPLSVDARYFSDVSAYSQEYKDAMSFVADNGYMNGTYTNMFSPAGTMTRAMFVTVLYNMAGRPAVTNTIPFPDVASSAWYYDPVRWAYGVGLVSGSGTGNFSPDASIAKQDASLILYKYAVNKGLLVTKQDSLDAYSDKNSVSSYALTAVKWAVATRIYPNGGATALTPATSFTRADMALMITRFGTNVEYIDFGRDNYSFNNSSTYFTNTSYFIYGSHLDYLASCIYAAYDNPTTAYNTVYSINEYRQEEWQGSCYGMALTTILDKLGKIDLNGNFASNAQSMYSIQMQRGSITESAINYYHISQLATAFRTGRENYRGHSLSDRIDQAITDLTNHKGLGLFTYFWDEGTESYGHTVVVYDITKLADNYYQLTAYDNRYANAPVAILLKAGDVSNCFCKAKLGNGELGEVRSIEVQTDFAAYDNIDLDDDLNVGGNLTLTQASNETLFIELTGEFEIENSEGQHLIWSDFELQGDMAIMDSTFIVESPDTPLKLMVVMDESESLTLTSLTEGAELNAKIMNSNGVASISGVTSEKVYFDSMNNVYLNGDAIQ